MEENWKTIKNLAVEIFKNSEYDIKIKPFFDVVTEKIILSIDMNNGGFLMEFENEKEAANFMWKEFGKYINLQNFQK